MSQAWMFFNFLSSMSDVTLHARPLELITKTFLTERMLFIKSPDYPFIVSDVLNWDYDVFRSRSHFILHSFFWCLTDICKIDFELKDHFHSQINFVNPYFIKFVCNMRKIWFNL